MRKKIIYCFAILLLANGILKAQLTENFNDGDFTNDPAWTGNTSAFIVNNALQLQSNHTISNSSFYLSTASTLAASTQWEFWAQITFNPSSANYIDVYLTASASDLNLNSTAGYFVRIGNTDDEISLYRKDASGAITKIIDGENGVLNKSNNVMKIKVTRDQLNRWTLLRDMAGTGNNYISEGTATDATYTTSGYFGFLIKQSTSSFFKKHFFDDIEIKNYEPDISPPEIQSATAISNTQVDVLFNEPLENVSATLFSNYSANNGLGMPVSAIRNVTNHSLVHLTFGTTFINGYEYTLTVNGVKDLSGNATFNKSTTFSFYIPQKYDVVIDELFPDPNPQVTLPLLKFLELKNVSAFPINLHEWKLIDGSSIAKLPNFTLRPDSFVIICASNSTASFLPYGTTLGVANFPSMNIGGSTIVLKSSSNEIIHAVKYNLASYKNELKKDGGWTLEMIDTKNPCGGASNWKASTHASGGTPGRKNAVDAINKDETSPKLLRAFAANDTTVTLVFDEQIDGKKASSLSNYSFDKGLIASSVIPLDPFFDKVNVTVNNPLEKGIIYTVAVKNISDCSGNIISDKSSAKFGIAQDADSLDVIINEILFNPPPMGVDYVELYNRSKKIIDLNKMFLANRNSSNIVSSVQPVSSETYLLFPQEFVLLTTDPDIVKSQFITTNPDAFLKMNLFPSYPNTSGNVIVLNHHGNSIDEVKYHEKWHFQLIKNAQGVSLERIDYDGPSIQSNFHSAATSVGYGTPGYKNSQYKLNDEVHGEITVVPEIFSPDNDGIDDFVTINYSFPSAGFVTNLTIFDASGRPVRYLQKNSLSGIKGYYRWDGLDDKNRKLPQGIYIIYTEIFNVDGRKKSFKNTVVLGRRY
jgi:hypothetical protein